MASLQLPAQQLPFIISSSENMNAAVVRMIAILVIAIAKKSKIAAAIAAKKQKKFLNNKPKFKSAWDSAHSFSVQKDK